MGNADRKSCSTPKFTKNYESPTAMLRILALESAFDTSRFFLSFYAWLKVACARIAALHKVLHYFKVSVERKPRIHLSKKWILGVDRHDLLAQVSR